MAVDKKSITMKDVAKRAGVSVGTVSRVINDEAGIKEVTLVKVREAIEELNYIPDAYARGMKKNKTETVALIIPTIWHPFFAEFAYHVENALGKQNYKILLCNTNGVKKDIEYITMLQQNKVDGIIAITYNPIENYLASGIPFVSIDRSYINRDIAWIASDNKKGGILAAETLIDKGASVLAFIGSHNETHNETKKRRFYFEQTIKERNYEYYILDVEEPCLNFKEQLEQFLHKYKKIDGIFTVNDFTALDVIEILEKMGKQIPEDVQIIGYDGIRYAQEREYPLSTIKQSLKEIAQKSVEVLLAIIEGEPYQSQTIIPISFIEGKTTKN